MIALVQSGEGFSHETAQNWENILLSMTQWRQLQMITKYVVNMLFQLIKVNTYSYVLVKSILRSIL
jgi:hypothetical protein